MLRRDEFTRDLISEAIRSAVDSTVQKHLPALTQEPQLTSRIAEALEQRLNGMRFLNSTVRVVTQELPDRGRGALEHETGVDLFVGLKVETGRFHLAKGLFVQAKWAAPLTSRERKDLVSQCKFMLRHTDKGALVWLYGPLGTSVVPASEVVENPMTNPSELCGRNVAELFSDVMDCVSGDRALVMPGIFDDRQALGRMLEEFRVRQGVVVNIKADKSSRE
ncbi:MAG: hypothetical protein ACJ8FT_08185 [Sphingomonas sp.]